VPRNSNWETPLLWSDEEWAAARKTVVTPQSTLSNVTLTPRNYNGMSLTSIAEAAGLPRYVGNWRKTDKISGLARRAA
jgi:hypothetical protein